jgi:hypothetical protein
MIMKRNLLLYLAIGSSVGAFAIVPSVNRPEETSEMKLVKDSRFEKVENIMLNQQISKSINEATSLNVKVTDDSSSDGVVWTPCYRLPAGTFYAGFIAGTSLSPMYTLSGSRYIYTDAFSEHKWTNTSSYNEGTATKLPTFNWSYYALNSAGTAFETQTATSTNLTTPAIGLYKNVAVPSLTIGDETFQPIYEEYSKDSEGNYYVSSTSPAIFQPYGDSFYNFGDDMGTLPVAQLPWDTDNMDKGSYFNQFNKGKTIKFEDGTQTVNGYGLYVGQPTEPWGLEGITFLGYIASYSDTDLSFSVYTVRDSSFVSDGETYTMSLVGERIGGGSLAKADIITNSSQYTHNYIPVIEGEGETTYESFLNIDQPVYIQIEGYDNSPVYPWGALGLSTNIKFLNASSNYFENLGDNQWLYNMKNTTWTLSSGGDASYHLGGLGIGVVSAHTFFNQDGDSSDKEFVASTSGESKTFTFTPYYDIASVSKYDGEGLDEWYTVDIADLNKTDYTQNVTVTVKALPEGVTGRSSVLKLELPGAVQNINITQGEVNAVNTVVADAETVGVEYFNMQGQKLAQEPANGFFIKKEIKSNGSIQATKVIK